jgi:hypothetical protein
MNLAPPPPARSTTSGGPPTGTSSAFTAQATWSPPSPQPHPEP